MQDGTPGSSGVREDRGHDGGVIAVRGHVDEEAASVGGGLDCVLLGGDEVTDALFGPGVAVVRVGGDRVGC